MLSGTLNPVGEFNPYAEEHLPESTIEKESLHPSRLGHLIQWTHQIHL